MDLGCNPKRPTEPWSLALTLTPGSLHRGPKGSSTSAQTQPRTCCSAASVHHFAQGPGRLHLRLLEPSYCHPCPGNAGFICLSALAEHLFLYPLDNTVLLSPVPTERWFHLSLRTCGACFCIRSIIRSARVGHLLKLPPLTPAGPAVVAQRHGLNRVPGIAQSPLPRPAGTVSAGGDSGGSFRFQGVLRVES